MTPNMKIEIEHSVVIESVELLFVNHRELRLSGALATITAQSAVERLLKDVHSHILTSKLRSFVVDVRLLKFVNSSALRLFINWISRAEAAGYTLVFVTDPGLTWHRLNFAVLKALSPQSVEIQ